MIAALYVQTRGIYAQLPGVDVWDEARDARSYAGLYPVVAHPPCASWGRYSKPTPTSTARGPLRGEDGGCFAAALASVRQWGGVLEHPKDTAAWAAHGLPAPEAWGWSRVMLSCRGSAWVCLVDQGHYGHMARKPTRLLAVLPVDVPPPVTGVGPIRPCAHRIRRASWQLGEPQQTQARSYTPTLCGTAGVHCPIDNLLTPATWRPW